MSGDEIALTPADVASGLRALADMLERHGLPDRTHPDQALSMGLYVPRAEDVTSFAAAHGLPAEVRGTHTSVELVAGPNPSTYRGPAAFRGAVVLRVSHIAEEVEAEPEPEDSDDEEAPDWNVVRAAHQRTRELSDSFKPEPAVVVDAVFLELDGVVMKTTADDEYLPGLRDDGWEQITREEAMSWRPLDAEDDGTVSEALAEVQPPVLVDSFAPPADAEPADGGRIPVVQLQHPDAPRHTSPAGMHSWLGGVA